MIVEISAHSCRHPQEASIINTDEVAGKVTNLRLVSLTETMTWPFTVKHQRIYCCMSLVLEEEVCLSSLKNILCLSTNTVGEYVMTSTPVVLRLRNRC